MAYSADTFVADEQPTTAKWNKLWSNDASFNDGSGFANGAIGSVNASIANGIVVQMSQTNYSGGSSGTGTIPFDNTIPQITEGTEFMTIAITPKSTTNILIIEAVGLFSISVANGNATASLFQNSTADALATNTAFMATSSGRVIVPVSHKMVAGTTSSTTFRFRAGNDVAATTYFNQNSPGTDIFGASTSSWIRVTEIKAT